MPGAPTKSAKKSRQSEYGKRLSMKQTAKNEYGLREKQFRRYFDMARKVREATGAKLLELLELRLDNVVYRLDLSQSRAQARQWIGHGHVKVNGKKMTIPSYHVAVGDAIELKNAKLLAARGVDLPVWLSANTDKTGGTIAALPSRDDIMTDIDEQLIVEFYSR